ncbi:MAG: hypothetical protein AMJ92_01410 [candidate division Zixibacteria bacterium SM23_81]|nr:MAG: hypothetical protein AMJ92_01410 [candidate division Zixibacteria bacterium SM23_81]
MFSPKIEEYRFGYIVIDGRSYSSDVIIHAQGVEPDWWRMQGHSLSPHDVKSILDRNPEILVVGTGGSGMMVVTEETRRLIRHLGIQLVVERTQRACHTYNRLSPSKRTVAALHLTC